MATMKKTLVLLVASLILAFSLGMAAIPANTMATACKVLAENLLQSLSANNVLISALSSTPELAVYPICYSCY